VLTLAVLAGPWPRLGVIAAAVLAATAILARTDTRRALAMLGAIVLSPVLLLDDVWHSSKLDIVHRHPAEAVVGALIGLALLAALAHLIRRKPWLTPVLTMVALAFRIPIKAGGGTSNLLVPLYVVIAAAALSWIVPALRASRAGGGRNAHTDRPNRRPDVGERPSRPRRHLAEQLLAAYVVLYALQALYSTDFVGALQNEVFFYVPFAVLLALLRDVDWDRRLLVRCLAVTAAMAVIFACIGFGEELSGTLWLKSNVAAANQLHEYFQVNSVFFDPNIFGRYLALTMVLMVTVLLYDKRTRMQLVAIGTLAFLWGCMIFTLSRSSLAALALGMAVLAAFRWHARVRLIVVGMVVVVIAGAAVVATHPGTFGLNQGANGATGGRAGLISGGVHLFRDKPLAGWGSGSFSTEYRRHFPKSARNVSDSHNIPVTIAAEQGVIGLAFYIALLVSALALLLRDARGDPFRIGIAATFLALLLHTMLYADFLEDPTTWVLLGIGGALAAASSARPRPGRPPRREVTPQVEV